MSDLDEYPDILQLKRSSFDSVQESKRYKHYQDEYGGEIIIDKPEELYDGDFLQMMGEEKDGQDTYKNAKNQEAQTRKYIAAELVRSKKRAKQKLSRAEAKLQKAIIQENKTNEDFREVYGNDPYTLVSVPIEPPLQAFINKTLGPEQPRSKCFGCTKGLGMAGIVPDAVEELTQYINEQIANQDIWVACIMISKKFEIMIRIPSNKGLKSSIRKEKPIEEWSPRSVYDHLTKHILNPTYYLYNIQMQLRQHREIIMSSLYKVPREVQNDSNRPIEKSDIIVDESAHKKLMETISKELQVMDKKPEKMLWSNTNLSLRQTAGAVIRPKANTIQHVNFKSEFDRTDLSSVAKIL